MRSSTSSLLFIVIASLWLAAACGCIELAALINGRDLSDRGGGFPDADPIPDEPDGGAPDPIPDISASNVAPLPGEEVEFRCSLPASADGSATFEFTSNSNRLSTDSAAGIATLIVDETDVGTEITVTCRAVFDDGVSESSAELTVIPQPGVSEP